MQHGGGDGKKDESINRQIEGSNFTGHQIQNNINANTLAAVPPTAQILIPCNKVRDIFLYRDYYLSKKNCPTLQTAGLFMHAAFKRIELEDHG